MISFVGEDVRGVGYGGFVGSVYADCVDYEVRRRKVGEGDRGGELGIGDVDCILLYMICFGDELGIWGLRLGVSVLDTLGCLGYWVCWGSEVRKPSLVHLKHSRTDRIS